MEKEKIQVLDADEDANRLIVTTAIFKPCLRHCDDCQRRHRSVSNFERHYTDWHS